MEKKFFLPVWVMEGLNVSVVIIAWSLIFHMPTPSADPAAIAAPSAVVSGIEGRTGKYISNYWFHSN